MARDDARDESVDCGQGGGGDPALTPDPKEGAPRKLYPSKLVPRPFNLWLRSRLPLRPIPPGLALGAPLCRGGSCVASQKIGVGARLLSPGSRAPQGAHALAAQARGTFQSGQWRCSCEPRRVGCGAWEPHARRARVHSLPRVRRARNAACRSRPQQRAQRRSAAAAAFCYESCELTRTCL